MPRRALRRSPGTSGQERLFKRRPCSQAPGTCKSFASSCSSFFGGESGARRIEAFSSSFLPKFPPCRITNSALLKSSEVGGSDRLTWREDASFWTSKWYFREEGMNPVCFNLHFVGPGVSFSKTTSEVQGAVPGLKRRCACPIIGCN